MSFPTVKEHQECFDLPENLKQIVRDLQREKLARGAKEKSPKLKRKKSFDQMVSFEKKPTSYWQESNSCSSD